MSAGGPGGRPAAVVLHTPATLAGDLEAGEELERIARACRTEDGRIEKEMLVELAASGWLRQARWRRGGYLTTSGLREATGSPELVMSNVPGVFAPWAYRVLNRIAAYVLDSGVRLRPGQVFTLTDPELSSGSVTFDLVEPGEPRLPAFTRAMLAVIPLP